mmetsp:Transcript_2893/g.6688  ORF Transcript_2893/g.6688 Transcript_2893/m.6688 type:complete len:500 (+) Transcript_2893:190-1689(+)
MMSCGSNAAAACCCRAASQRLGLRSSEGTSCTTGTMSTFARRFTSRRRPRCCSCADAAGGKRPFSTDSSCNTPDKSANEWPSSSFPPESYLPKRHFHFELLCQSSSKSMARVGRIHTPHGIVETPSFVPVATNSALKGVSFADTARHPLHLVFANAYHLMLQPGTDVIRDAGGLHKYSGNTHAGPFITDSGGFQVFSLAYGSVAEELASQGNGSKSGGAELKRSKDRITKKGWRSDVMGPDAVKVTEDGVTFRSYRDGTKVLLTPESTIQAQKEIGADIIIPLDELPPYHISREKLEESLDRSHRWEVRSLKEHLKDVRQQAIYCVIHGGIDVELRTRSIDYLTALPFDGWAIGGSLGNGRKELKQLLDWMMPLFETEQRRYKPRHLLGIGDEESIRNAVRMGLDTLDSCYPTRLGRHGTLMTRDGLLRIKRGANARQFGVRICDGCNCKTCRQYDRAYLCHLFKAREPLGVMLATQHNLQYMSDLMAELRVDIAEGRL